MEIVEDKLLKINGVLDLVNISKSKLYDLIKKGKFPEPLELGGNKLWSASAVQNFIQKVKSDNQANKKAS